MSEDDCDIGMVSNGAKIEGAFANSRVLEAFQSNVVIAAVAKALKAHDLRESIGVRYHGC